MSPLGLPLLVLLALATVGAPAGTYLLWSKVPGPAWGRALARWGMVVVAQVCALGLAAAAINDYGQIFSTWGEVFAAVSPPVDSVHAAIARSTHAGTLRHYGTREAFVTAGRLARLPSSAARPTDPRSSAAPLPAVTWTAWSPRRAWRSRGAVAGVVLNGATTRLSGPAEVYLPAAYFRGDRRLPVVEVFTGYPGAEQSLIARLHYPDFLSAQVARHRAVPMVLVMARPDVTFPRDTECTNVPNDAHVLTYWMRDVPAAVAALFGLRPTAYAAMGDSTGGYCAAKLAVVDPRRFVAGVSLSGYFNAEEDATTGELFGGSARLRDLSDLRWRLRHLPAPGAHLLLGTSIGEVGPDGYQAQTAFAALVRPPMSLDLLTLRQGFGHSFATWEIEIPTALTWLSWQLLSHSSGDRHVVSAAPGGGRSMKRHPS